MFPQLGVHHTRCHAISPGFQTSLSYNILKNRSFHSSRLYMCRVLQDQVITVCTDIDIPVKANCHIIFLLFPEWWWLMSMTASCCLGQDPKMSNSNSPISRLRIGVRGGGDRMWVAWSHPSLAVKFSLDFSCLVLQPTKLIPVAEASGSQTKCLDVSMILRR